MPEAQPAIPPPVPAPEVPVWRREPYRVLFPLGVLLTWAGVGRWLAMALGLDVRDGVFHSIAQIQGFMMCFVTGFLFTAIPRRTQTAPPATWEMALAVLAPLTVCAAAWAKMIALSQAAWGALLLTLVAFAGRRFLSREAGRRPPGPFLVWVPAGFGMGVAGAALTGAYARAGQELWHLHELGIGLLLQGMLIALVIGVGSMVLPLLTRGDAPPDAEPTTRDRLRRLGHAAGAAALLLSFWIEHAASRPAGYGLRALVVTVMLVAAARLHRLPSKPGWHRWLVWGSAWAIPLGYALAALAPPATRQAWLHVVFIGGFATMALAVGLHVTLAHGGYQQDVNGRLWRVPALGAALGVAVVARALMILDAGRYMTWLGVASAAFLAATAVWLTLVVPRLRDAPPPGLSPPASGTA